MLIEIKKKWQRALILPKMVWTMAIALIYMFGRMLPITTLAGNPAALQEVTSNQLINQLASVTGANFSNITIFTLGLSPWMTSMIIWRFFTVFGILKNITTAQLHRYRMLLTMGVGAIQAFGLTSAATFTLFQEFGEAGLAWARAITIFLLITGSFVLTWLGSVNSRKGLGGMTIIILVNMILSFVENIGRYLATGFTDNRWLNVVLFALCWFVLVLVTVIFYRAEYRIPIKRIGVNNAYNKGSYLPIRVTPAGAMPFMYGMTLMMLPPYLISGLLVLFPENPTLLFLATNIGISRLPGVFFYIILLYILAIGFSYYNYDAYEIAKSMRRNGDYIEKIRPGEVTRKYIQRKINILAQFGACFVILMGGVPLLIIVWQKGTSENVSLALLISNVFIISSLLLGVIEQVDMLQNWKKYKNLI